MYNNKRNLLMERSKKVYESIDLFKFMAAILVVAIHSKPFAYDDDINYYFTCFCRIAVPYFFICSSFLFFSKEKPDIKKYSKRLISLYIAWFIIEFPFVYKRFFVDYDHPFFSQMLNVFRSLVFNNTWYASWFIMACIISTNIVYYLSHRLNNKQLLLLGWGGYFFSLLCSSYSGMLDLLLDDNIKYYHAAFSYFFMPANSFIVALIYVVLGKIIADYIRSKKQLCIDKKMNIYLLFLFVVLGIIEVHFIRWSVVISDAFLFLPFFIVLAFILILRTKVDISPSVSRLLRSMSILIYILHAIFVSVNPKLFDINSGMTMFFVTLIESIVLAWLIISLSNKAPLLKRLY